MMKIKIPIQAVVLMSMLKSSILTKFDVEGKHSDDVDGFAEEILL